MSSYPSTITTPSRRQMALLSPLDTTFSSSSETSLSQPPPPYTTSATSTNPEKDIFAAATIPLSPTSSTSSSTSPTSTDPYAGLEPRKRSGIARLFCCFGRQERARRRLERSFDYEKVGEKCHWSEY